MTDLETKSFEEEEEEAESQSDEEETLTPLAEENKKILSSRHYSDLFYEIYLEMFDLEKSFMDSQQHYTDILLRRGIDVNPEKLYKTIEMALTRITRILMVKRLCHGLGLHAEVDQVVSKELDLIYRIPNTDKSNIPSPGTTGEKNASRE